MADRDGHIYFHMALMLTGSKSVLRQAYKGILGQDRKRREKSGTWDTKGENGWWATTERTGR